MTSATVTQPTSVVLCCVGGGGGAGGFTLIIIGAVEVPSMLSNFRCRDKATKRNRYCRSLWGREQETL